MAILNNSNAISSGGYDINNSLRFRSSATAYLNRTPATAGNRKTWTWSAWVKLGALGTTRGLFGAQTTAGADTDRFFVRLNSSDKLFIYEDISNIGTTYRITTQVFRDPSAWYHIVVAFDTTQATADNRIKLYVNGNQITVFDTNNAITLNRDTFVNAAIPQSIGADRASTLLLFDGYMAEVNFVNAQQLTPSSFGETDTTTGSWKPKAYTGTYGTNGFYLKFSDIATTSGSNAGLGKDFSGNANYWTTNNISVTSGTTYDAMIDSPTLTSATTANYATMNPLELGDGAPAALSNGNLTITGSASLFLRRGTMNFPLTGKYYCEFTVTAVGSGVSIAYDSRGQSGATQFIQYDNGGTKNINGTTTSYGASFTTGDIVAMAVDADGGSIAFYKNNTSQGSITFSSASMTGVNATAMVFAYTSAIVNANFGQRPFSYTPPTGFVRLNTYNLPTPTILQGNKYMDATLFTGNGVGQSIVNNAQFKPDFVWWKDRTTAGIWHMLSDSVRGTGKTLSSNQTDAEYSGYTSLTAFNNNGFTLGLDTGTGYFGWNTNAKSYVAWQWKAGQGSTSSNTSGSITSTVSVNATAGFSVVTFTKTGTATVKTVGHGLGVAPSWIIAKVRNGVDNWPVYHISNGATFYQELNTTIAKTSSDPWGNTTPTPSVFSIKDNGTSNFVAYCWAEIAGFSKFTSYASNNSVDGPFVYLGFRPKFVMIKPSTFADQWMIFDSSRNAANLTNNVLYPNLSNAEAVDANNCLDLLSNGFKIRGTGGSVNYLSNTYIVMAFAENPFKNANAR